MWVFERKRDLENGAIDLISRKVHFAFISNLFFWFQNLSDQSSGLTRRTKFHTLQFCKASSHVYYTSLQIQQSVSPFDKAMTFPDGMNNSCMHIPF